MTCYVPPGVVRHNLRLPARDNRTPGGRFSCLFGKPCPYCAESMWGEGSRFPTKDHVRPKSRGGGDSPGNILIVCRDCNGDKSDLTLTEFYDALAFAADRRAEIIHDLLLKRGAKLDEAPQRAISPPPRRRTYRISRPISQFHAIAAYLKSRRERTGIQVRKP
jgi:hypothetical protein